MLSNGARNETEKEILQVLHYDSISSGNKKHCQLNKQMQNDDFVDIKISNSIWIKRGLHINPNFEKVGREEYNGKIDK